MSGNPQPSASADANPLRRAVAVRIVEMARGQGLAPGARLVERRLCEALGVSRTPVRNALRLLEERGVIEIKANDGYYLRRLPRAGKQVGAAAVDDELYFLIAKDRFDGRLPEQVSESELVRRYGATRPAVLRALMRFSKEGLASRDTGRGWTFLPFVNSIEACRHSYEYRLAIEPAALRAPGYRIDRERFDRVYQNQARVIAGGLAQIDGTTMFELNAEFHEMIVAGSGNPLFIQGVRQQNALRRLLEYAAFADAARMIESCHEHIAILDAVRGGDRMQAAELLLDHLGAGLQSSHKRFRRDGKG